MRATTLEVYSHLCDRFHVCIGSLTDWYICNKTLLHQIVSIMNVTDILTLFQLYL
jgi:hypothetical protein